MRATTDRKTRRIRRDLAAAWVREERVFMKRRARNLRYGP